MHRLRLLQLIFKAQFIPVGHSTLTPFMVMIAHLNHSYLGHHPGSLLLPTMFVLLCLSIKLVFARLSSSPSFLSSIYIKYRFLKLYYKSVILCRKSVSQNYSFMIYDYANMVDLYNFKLLMVKAKKIYQSLYSLHSKL